MDVYEDRSFRTNFVVGLLGVAIMAGLAVVIAFFLAKEQPLARTVAVAVRFSDVAGLKTGAPVTLMGAGIGRVDSLSVDPGPEGTAWRVRLAIRDEPWIRERVTTTSTFTLVSESVFGNKYVNVSFGDAGEPLADGAVVRGIVGAGIDAKTFEKLSSALENLSGAAAELRGMLADSPQGTTRTVNIKTALANLDTTLRNASEASGALKEALSTENQEKAKQTFDDLAKASANLANVTERMKAGMDSWAETMDKMRFWRGWFGDGGDPEKKNGDKKKQ